MRSTALLLLVIAVAFGCGKKEEQKTDKSIQFEMRTFRLESSEGCKSDTLKCASYEVEYPMFNGLSQVVNDSLNQKIIESIDTGNPEIESHSFEEAGEGFIKDFERAQKEFPDNTMGWYFRASVDVNLLTDTLLSLESSAEFFTGGAHGGYGTYFINIRPSTGRAVTLDDVMRSGYQESLRAIGESEFRRSLTLTDTVSLAEEGFEFPDDKFQLNDNYGFTSEGILFEFNIYEIAPYVLGAQEVLIPYDKIRDLLK
jgi:hypothetical protein